MEKLTRIWQENRRFILLAGGGLAVFLILQSCVIQGIQASANGQAKRNRKTQDEVEKLQDQVFARAGDERKAREDLAAIEKDVRSRFLTPRPRSVPDPKVGAPQLQFSQRIESIWSELQVKANQKNVKIPEKISPADLGVSAADGPEEHLRNAAYLEVLARGLHACVDHGIAEIGKVVIVPEGESRIRAHDDAVVVYRQVQLPVSGPYESYRRLLRAFQTPGDFVQARLMSLDARGSGSTARLRGVLEFVGVEIWQEGQEEVRPAEPVPEKPKTRPGVIRKKKKNPPPGPK